MISRIEIENYGCFQQRSFALESRTIVVGPSGSGKSLLLDLMSFFRDLIVQDLQTALGMRSRNAHEVAWGNTSQLIRLAVNVRLPEALRQSQNLETFDTVRYGVALGFPMGHMSKMLLLAEQVVMLNEDLVENYQLPLNPGEETQPADMFLPWGQPGYRITMWRDNRGSLRLAGESDDEQVGEDPPPAQETTTPIRSALALLSGRDDEYPVSHWLLTTLRTRVRHYAFEPAALSEPTPFFENVTHMRGNGTSFALALEHLQSKSPDRWDTWRAAVREMFPAFKSVSVKSQGASAARYVEVAFHGGLTLPSWRLSKGLLQGMALCLAAATCEPDEAALFDGPLACFSAPQREALLAILDELCLGQIVIATPNTPDHCLGWERVAMEPEEDVPNEAEGGR